MNLKPAELWMDEQLKNWMAGKHESRELVRHVEFSAKELRQIQADALRTVLGIGGAFDIAPSVRRQLKEKANQLDPRPEA